MCRIHGNCRVFHHYVLYLNAGLITISIRHAETHVPVIGYLDVLKARVIACLTDKYAIVMVLIGSSGIIALNSQRRIEKGKVLCLGMLGTGATCADKETILPIA